MDSASCFGQLDATTGREKQRQLTQSKNLALQSSCMFMYGWGIQTLQECQPREHSTSCTEVASTLAIDLSAVLFMYVYVYKY